MQIENSDIYIRQHEHKHTSPYIKGFFILLFITVIEVLIPVLISNPRWLVVGMLLTFTIIKAAYIVMIFMHMAEEKRDLIITILCPFLLFISYFIFIMLNEGAMTKIANHLFGG